MRAILTMLTACFILYGGVVMSDKVAIKKSKDMIKQIISEDIKDENIKYVVNLAFKL